MWEGLHLEQNNNLQDSEKGEIDYSHGVLRLNSALPNMERHVPSRIAEMSVGISKLKVACQHQTLFYVKITIIHTPINFPGLALTTF